MTPVTFRERSTGELGTQKVVNIGKATRRKTIDRINASADYPPMDAMRDRAREIRLHTLANLSQYLAQFADSVERVGGHVYFAADADEANRYVAQLAADRGVRSIVKSKSMVTEEIHLNEALEAVGVEPVETDLGEFIVQLAGETPSHIIAPAMHMTRQRAAQLLSREAGRELVARLARKICRPIVVGVSVASYQHNLDEGGCVALENLLKLDKRGK